MSNIDVVRKRLGPVTAYKYAVQQGYTGTEQEFAALMASYATVAEEAESAKDDAVDAKTAAEAAQAAAEAAAEQAEGAIEVDDTLSVKGRAADAKVTGNRIKEVKDSLKDNYNTATKTLYYYDLSWERGYINASGDVLSSQTYVVTELLKTRAGDSIAYDGLRASSTNFYIVAFYDSNKSFVSSASVKPSAANTAEAGSVVVPSGCEYVRFSTYVYDNSNYFRSIEMPVTTLKADDNAKNIRMLSDPVEWMQYTVTGFDQFSFTESGGININTGAQYDYQYMKHTDYIPTDGIISVTAKIKGLNKWTSCIACYDKDKNYLKSVSLYPDIEEAGFSTWQYAEGTITITNSLVKYIIVSIAINTQHDNDLISVVRTRSLKADYLVTKQNVSNIEQKINPWEGKNWFAFGTSMTDDWYPNVENDRKPTGVFPKYLQELSGMVQFNHGKAGGTIGTGGQYSASGQIYTEITTTDFSTADLITLEGFINDFAMCIPLGDLGDTTQETFYGALYKCIKYLSENNTNATIVVITDPVGKEYTFTQGESAGITQDYSTTKVNALGLHQVDYTNAMVKTCQWMGVHCIDAGSKSQINEYHPQYIVDQCHQTELGGKQFAYTIWEELKNIHPNTEVVVEE